MKLFGSPTPAPSLLLTQIDYTKSMVHAAAQEVGRVLCAGIGHINPADWDEWLKSEPGRRFMQSIRDGAVHLLNKGMDA